MRSYYFLIGKCVYKKYSVDMFSSVSEVYVPTSEFYDLSDVDSRMHQIIILEIILKTMQ